MSSSTSLHYRIVGDGYPVVFLHGFLETNHIWENILPHMKDIQAICIELPGHGKSPLLAEELSLSNIAQAVYTVIKNLNLPRFSMVGHSMGGYTALNLYELASEKIDHLILLHSHPWADPKEKKNNRTRAARVVEYDKMLFLNEAIPYLYHKQEAFTKEIQHAIKIAQTISEEAIIQSLLAMRDREDKVNVLEMMGKNLHIIQGEYDVLIDASIMQAEARIHHNTFDLIKDIGHNGYDEAPEQVICLLNRCLQPIGENAI
ncbi:MAG: alpha/beta hydrolase [Brumimicrobium sp.]|nr:alpha/beta hydrolase [Brumimicrobium sp.]